MSEEDNFKQKELQAAYLESLNEKEKLAYEIAKDHLGSSYSLEKSIGFVLFESKPESDSIKLSIRDRLVDGKVIQGRFIGK